MGHVIFGVIWPSSSIVACLTSPSGAIDAFGIHRAHFSVRCKLKPCDTSSLISALIVSCPCRTDLCLPQLSMNIMSSLHALVRSLQVGALHYPIKSLLLYSIMDMCEVEA